MYESVSESESNSVMYVCIYLFIINIIGHVFIIKKTKLHKVHYSFRIILQSRLAEHVAVICLDRLESESAALKCSQLPSSLVHCAYAMPLLGWRISRLRNSFSCVV